MDQITNISLGGDFDYRNHRILMKAYEDLIEDWSDAEDAVRSVTDGCYLYVEERADGAIWAGLVGERPMDPRLMEIAAAQSRRERGLE